MRKWGILLIFSFIALAGGVIYSCSKEKLTVPEKENTLKSAVLCVQEVTPVVANVLGGGNPRTKIGEVKIWNDNLKVYIEIGTFTYDNVKLVKFLETSATEPANAVFNANTVSSATNHVLLSYDIPAGWEFWTSKRFFIRIEGKAGGRETYTLDYELQKICEGCEESFTAVDNQDLTYTFTYTPEEDMENAELGFTFAQSAYQEGFPEDQGWAQAGNEGQTMHATMDLTACQTYTWTVKLVANCSGHAAKSNVWTDFKVNDVSKKKDLENFTQTCP